MKTLIILVLALLTIVSNAQTTSSITYDVGSTIEVQTGADICATNIYINGSWSGGGSVCGGALPITMLSFSAAVESKVNVKLGWTTGTEINNSGFDIERKQEKEGSVWQKIAFVPGRGNTNEPVSYSYEDKKLQTGKYKFRLKQIDYNGSYEYFETENLIEIARPFEFAIGQNYPNPGNPKSKIDYQLPVNGRVTIKIYSMLGQEVFDLLNATKEAGYYTVEFDGSNLASGVYFYRISSEGEGQNFNKSMKLILVK